MDIKFKKIFKTTLLFFVVFVMIFNSFAAISVSDGSAFVTKAEFSADLNNLSNRMAALENSIDAKVDSLVSSYLSRNGIWNGEKQTTNSTTSWNIAPRTFTLSNYSASWSGNLKNETLISQITKSGLLVGFLYFVDGGSANTNDSRWGYTITMKDFGNWFSDCGMSLSINLYETLKDSTTANIKSSVSVGNEVATFREYYFTNGERSDSVRNGAILTIGLPASRILCPVNFFVQKDSKITLTVYQAVHLVNVSSQQKNGHTLQVGFTDQFNVY